MRISKVTSHAIRILVDCAQSAPDSVRSAEIAARQRITGYNIQKIVAQLAAHGFLMTSRGRNGGIQLSRPAEEIILGDVVRATEQALVEADCSGVQIDCTVRQMTPVNRIFDEAYTGFVEILDRYSLADLTRKRSDLPSVVNVLDAGKD